MAEFSTSAWFSPFGRTVIIINENLLHQSCFMNPKKTQDLKGPIRVEADKYLFIFGIYFPL